MTLIRFILGKLILFFNWLFSPRSTRRDSDAQAAIDAQTARLVLYQYEACPFCVKVRRAMKRHALNIETKDVKRSETAREELLPEVSSWKTTVACIIQIPRARSSAG